MEDGLFTEKDIPDLTGHRILVTGGNSGLGYWTAWQLSKAKASVVMGCRREKACAEAAAQIKKETCIETKQQKQVGIHIKVFINQWMLLLI